MISVPTTLILGAGASADYRFPAGSNFRNQICALQDEEKFLEEIEEHGVPNISEFLERFSRSAYDSPDRFIEYYPQFIVPGLYCIARVLKAYEVDRNLFPPNAPSPSWYEYLVNQLAPGSDTYYEKNLSIVTYNYDRSLEHYLWRVMESRFGTDHESRDKAWSARPEIIHVHGQLGPYDPYGNTVTPYVDMTSVEDLEAAQHDIRIITEVDPNETVFERADMMLQNAERIYFLGFGFDERNVHRLRFFPRQRSNNEIIGGTRTGIKNDDWGDIVDKVFEGGINGRAFDNSSIYDFLSKREVLS